MEIGIFTFAELHPDPVSGRIATAQQRLADVTEQAMLAEEVGLSVFGIGEHHRADFASASPAVILAAIAARTSTIRLTSAVTVLSSADPVAVLEDFTALDLVSGGRAEIMAGRGAFGESFPLYGFDLADYEALFEEKLELLLRLRDEESVTWSGQFRPALIEQTLYPRPAQAKLPVWIAVGGTPSSAERAGRLGLPMAVAIIGGQPRQFAGLVRVYRDAAEAGGHDAARLPVAITSHTYVAETSQRAVKDFYSHYAGYMHRVSKGRFRITPAGFDAGRGLEGALFVGSPQQIVEKLLFQHELFGHQRFMAQISLGSLPHRSAMRAIELLGTEVLPRLQRTLEMPVVSSGEPVGARAHVGVPG
jgi:probable LLM family oxidoreductase